MLDFSLLYWYKHEMIEKYMYENSIKNKGLSLTKHRVTLLDILAIAKKSITLKEIREYLGNIMNISIMYFSMRILIPYEIVYKIYVHDRVSYFKFQSDDYHHHLNYTVSKKKTSINVCPYTNFYDIEKPTRYIITHYIFEIFGLCKKCSK